MVTLIPKSDGSAACYLNGKALKEATPLHTGNRVILGKYHVFRFTHPQEARESRHNIASLSKRSAEQRIRFASVETAKDGLAGEEPIDWYYAQHELLEKQGIDLKLEMAKK